MANDRFGHPKRLLVEFDIVDAQDFCTAFPTYRGERNARPESVIHRHGTYKPSEEGFARDAYEQRSTEAEKSRKLRQKPSIVLGRFSKSDSWVKSYAHRVYARRYRPSKGVSKKFPDFGDDILVGRRDLHRAGLALHMHDDDSRLGRGRERRHVRVTTQAGDIVDDIRTGIQRCPRDSGF
jgi:hypothetical protein